MRARPVRVVASSNEVSLLSGSVALVVVSLLIASAAPLANRSLASELRRTATVKIVDQARPSVVNIHGQKTLNPADEGFRPGEGPQNVNGMGTGVVIDERGYILTNHHVVEGVRKIQVTLDDDRTCTASLLSHDPKTDLAVIKINVPDKLQVVTIGTSNDLMPGEPVIAVGNAYGYGHTVTRGIISALHRTVQVNDAQSYADLIQTDASINPGNSGGPLLNIDGEMIGINVAVRAGAQGIGFAIPVDVAMEIAADLLSVQRVNHTWHGVVAKGDKSGTRQLVIGDVKSESPAAKSGLQPGDIVRKAGDLPVTRALDLERALLGYRSGEQVSLTVSRNQQPVTVNLTMAAAPRSEPVNSDRAWELIGMKLEAVPSDQFRQNQSHFRGGLLVTAVRSDSPAARQGITRGDILVGMHVWETVSLENVFYILGRPDLQSLEPIKFYILRDNKTRYGHLSVSARR